MKLKSLNNATLKRKGYVEIKDVILPIATQGTAEIRKVMREANSLYKIPMKNVKANEKELEALKSYGNNIGKLTVMVNRIDEESEEFKDYEDRKDKASLFLPMATQIDLLHPIADDPTLWEHLKVKSDKDILGVAEWLATLSMDENDRKVIIEKIDLIKNSTSKTYEDWDRITSKKAEEIGE